MKKVFYVNDRAVLDEISSTWLEGYEPSTELEDISIFKDHAEMLKDLADLHDVSVATVIDAILDEMYYNDEEWKDHLDL